MEALPEQNPIPAVEFCCACCGKLIRFAQVEQFRFFKESGVMLSFNRRTKIFVSKDPTDMRASYDTLFSKAKVVLNQDPFSGHLFLFINSKRTSIKCLYYDGTGFVIIAKRMEKGLFCRNTNFSG